MIQRIQSVYLLLIGIITLLAAFVFRTSCSMALPCLLAAITSLVAIFLYKNRKIQMLLAVLLMIFFGILFCMSVIVWGFAGGMLNKFEIIGLIPIIAGLIPLLLSIGAYRAIKKDEKLVRSLDRLR